MNFRRFYVLKIGLSEEIISYYFHDKKETLSARDLYYRILESGIG
jgi:hypothetical protein